MGKTDMIKGSDSKLKSNRKNHSDREKTKSQKIENPSATAEEKIIKASDAKQKSVRREKPNGSEVGRFFFLQNKKPSATAEDQS